MIEYPNSIYIVWAHDGLYDNSGYIVDIFFAEVDANKLVEQCRAWMAKVVEDDARLYPEEIHDTEFITHATNPHDESMNFYYGAGEYYRHNFTENASYEVLKMNVKRPMTNE